MSTCQRRYCKIAVCFRSGTISRLRSRLVHNSGQHFAKTLKVLHCYVCKHMFLCSELLYPFDITLCYIIGLITFEDINFHGFSKFIFKLKFSWKKIFEVINNLHNFCRIQLAHNGKMCDRFVHSSVIGGHHIYKDVLRPPLERHSRAKENYIDNSFTVA